MSETSAVDLAPKAPVDQLWDSGCAFILAEVLKNGKNSFDTQQSCTTSFIDVVLDEYRRDGLASQVSVAGACYLPSCCFLRTMYHLFGEIINDCRGSSHADVAVRLRRCM